MAEDFVFYGRWHLAADHIDGAMEIAASHHLSLGTVTYGERKETRAADALFGRVEGSCAVQCPAGTLPGILAPLGVMERSNLEVWFKCPCAPLARVNQIQYPRSVLHFYGKDHRERVMMENPDYTEESIRDVLREQFKAEDADTRRRYQQQEKDDKARYEKERALALKGGENGAQPEPELMWILTRNTLARLQVNFRLTSALAVARCGETLQYDIAPSMPQPDMPKKLLALGPLWQLDPRAAVVAAEGRAVPAPAVDAPPNYVFLLYQPASILPGERKKRSYRAVFRADARLPFQLTCTAKPGYVKAVFAPFSDPSERRDDMADRLVFEQWRLEGGSDVLWRAAVAGFEDLPARPLLIIIECTGQVSVEEDDEPAPRPASAQAPVPAEKASAADSAAEPDSNTLATVLVVDGLPGNASEEALRILFSCVDRVVKVQLEAGTNGSQLARVFYHHGQAVREAVQRFDGVEFGTCRLAASSSRASRVEASSMNNTTNRPKTSGWTITRGPPISAIPGSAPNQSLHDIFRELSQRTRDPDQSSAYLRMSRVVLMHPRRITSSAVAVAELGSELTSDFHIAFAIDRCFASGEVASRDAAREAEGAAKDAGRPGIPRAGLFAQTRHGAGAGAGDVQPQQRPVFAGQTAREGSSVPVVAGAANNNARPAGGASPYMLEVGSAVEVERHEHRLVVDRNGKFKPGALRCAMCGSLVAASATYASCTQVMPLCKFVACEVCLGRELVKNDDGVPVHQSLGHYYCDRLLGHYSDCGRCDGQCGPDDGCNCPSCHRMDEAAGRTEVWDHDEFCWRARG